MMTSNGTRVLLSPCPGISTTFAAAFFLLHAHHATTGVFEHAVVAPVSTTLVHHEPERDAGRVYMVTFRKVGLSTILSF